MTKEISRSEMLAEAVARMKTLEMDKNLIKEFSEEEKLYYSDPQGFLFWFKNATSTRNQEFRVPKAVFDALKSFEERTGYLVYHVIQNLTEIGTMWSFLYVSKNADEWESEKKELENGLLYAYVYNSIYPELSEASSIMVRPQYGGVVRTA